MKHKTIVYVSGFYSGPSPSPGIGVVRSLREGFGDSVVIIGVDYSAESSGLHFAEIDQVWLQPSFDQLDLSEYALQIKNILSEGAYWISTLDLELRWLSEVIGQNDRLLSVQNFAQIQIEKPEIKAANSFQFLIPNFLMIQDASEDEIYRFCRENSWQIWLKSPYYEAIKIKNWQVFIEARKHLTKKWKTENLFLQKHVSGHEESICFSANRGKLLDAVYMKKRITTPDGKTWAGKILELSESWKNALKEAVEKSRYHGGGELELMRNADDQYYLIEWNPRFPAWIHGSTLAGKNLVAKLLESVAGIKATMPRFTNSEFTRVVLEIQ